MASIHMVPLCILKEQRHMMSNGMNIYIFRYHHNFNHELFMEYIEEHLLPYLKSKSFIIMDQCSYHRKASPHLWNPRKANRHHLIEWLLSKGIDFQPSSKTMHLRNIALQYHGDPLPAVQLRCQQLGHTVLFLPPYHPEFNPIEISWSRIYIYIYIILDVKKQIADYPVFDAIKIMEEKLPRAFKYIQPDTCSNLFAHTDTELISARDEILAENPQYFMEIKENSQ